MNLSIISAVTNRTHNNELVETKEFDKMGESQSYEACMGVK